MPKPPQSCARDGFVINPQPTETSCGQTCLEAVYRFHQHSVPVDTLIAEIAQNDDGGTLSVQLALNALRHGFKTTIYSYNIRVFDPTWENLETQEIAQKLRLRLKRTRKGKARFNLESYIEYLEQGGKVRFNELTPALLEELLDPGIPILTGLSATHLYRYPRSHSNGVDDDIYGNPEGHFVLLLEYLPKTRQVVVADPYQKNPFCADLIYTVDVFRLINAIMLGIITYDANMLMIKPAKA